MRLWWLGLGIVIGSVSLLDELYALGGVLTGLTISVGPLLFQPNRRRL